MTSPLASWKGLTDGDLMDQQARGHSSPSIFTGECHMGYPGGIGRCVGCQAALGAFPVGIISGVIFAFKHASSPKLHEARRELSLCRPLR